MSMRMALRKREEISTGRMGAMSRASLVHGTNHTINDTWYDVDSFLLDQAKEVLNKLVDGSIDDEIWGKIVVMERCKRVAKAYLRKTTMIVDGSEDEFDGKTLGFNHFENSDRDEHTNEIRSKIGDGVILKMDQQGNIKGMARGTIPVITQGWRCERNSCISDRLIRQQGRLNTGEEEKAYKMFDMKKFKYCLERELHDGVSDPKSLLLKTCIRVALVKDGSDMSRTPCWFAIVNLVALDMLREKIPNIRKLVKSDILSTSVQSTQSPNSNSNFSQEALSQIIAAAVNQVNNGRTVNPVEIAQLANSLNFPSNANETISKCLRGSDLAKRKHYHCSSSSLDSSGEDTTKAGRRWENSQKLYESFYDSGIEKTREKERTSRNALSSRPRLSDVVFTRSHSITSDYDSNREVFDSGSWSSTNSRGFKTHSTASSLASETDLGNSSKDNGRAHNGETFDNSQKIYTDRHGKNIDDDSDISLHSVISHTEDSSVPSHHRSTTEIHIGSSENFEQKTDEDEREEPSDSAEGSCGSSGQVERLREASSRESAIEEGTEQAAIANLRETQPEDGSSSPLRARTPTAPSQIPTCAWDTNQKQWNNHLEKLQKAFLQRTQTGTSSTVRITRSERSPDHSNQGRGRTSSETRVYQNGLPPQLRSGERSPFETTSHNKERHDNLSQSSTVGRKQFRLRQQLIGLQQSRWDEHLWKRQPLWTDTSQRLATNQHKYCTLRRPATTSAITSASTHNLSIPVSSTTHLSEQQLPSIHQAQQYGNPRHMHGTARNNRSRTISGRNTQVQQWTTTSKPISSSSYYENCLTPMDWISQSHPAICNTQSPSVPEAKHIIRLMVD